MHSHILAVFKCPDLEARSQYLRHRLIGINQEWTERIFGHIKKRLSAKENLTFLFLKMRGIAHFTIFS
ncbi:hypothetical protein D3C86_2014350 [compost metagenome]